MKKIFSIFRTDLKSVTKNLIVFVVIIGITILPALYAWFNIASNWDPYSNTGEMSFAVSNLDEGYKKDGLEVNAGDKIKDSLKQNKQMNWEIVEKSEDAERGVEDGKYYAAVIIPKDFSKNLLSVTTGEFKQAKLEYCVNEKVNAITPKITDKVISAMQESADSSYVSTIAEAIASALDITSAELETEKDNLAQKVVTALENTKKDVESVNNSIDLLITTIDSIDAIIESNRAMAPTIQKSLSDVGVVTGDIKGMITATQNTSAQLTSVIGDLITSGDAYAQTISSQIDDAFSTISTDANTAAAKISKIEVINQSKIDVNNKLISIFTAIQSNLGIDCSKVIARLNSANEKQKAIIDKIESVCNEIKSKGAAPANAKAELDQLIAQADTELSAVAAEFSAIKQNIDNALTSSFSKLDSVAAFAQTLSMTTEQIDAVFDNCSKTNAKLKSVLENLKAHFASLTERIDTAVGKVDKAKSNDTLENIILPIIENPKALGEFLAAPVGYETKRYFGIDNYGSAMTPFYSSLALWVGGVVLVAVLNVDLTKRDLKKVGKVNSVQLFFGRYMIFFVLSQIQGLIIALGDLFFLGVQYDNAVLFIVGCMVSSLVYSLIIYSLTITFSVIGKALAVIILIMQVAGSGGTFPIEMLPEPFRSIAPFLPFRYGINMLRETIAGVNMESFLYNLGMLLLFIVPALVLGLVLRKPCIKIVAFFNNKVEESDLVI